MDTQIQKITPPFSKETAIKKVRMAENAWNTKNPQKVSLAYTPDSKWRNRSEFLNGREQIVEFLNRKWQKEKQYKLIKELWAYDNNRIAVRFCYEWLNEENNQWYRSYGNENWEFDNDGLMKARHASINDVPIEENQRKFLWEQDIRPDDYPNLSDLGL